MEYSSSFKRKGILTYATTGMKTEYIILREISQSQKGKYWDFPGSPVVKTLPSNAGGMGLIPGWGAKIPHAVWCGQKLKKKGKYCMTPLT